MDEGAKINSMWHPLNHRSSIIIRVGVCSAPPVSTYIHMYVRTVTSALLLWSNYYHQAEDGGFCLLLAWGHSGWSYAVYLAVE